MCPGLPAGSECRQPRQAGTPAGFRLRPGLNDAGNVSGVPRRSGVPGSRVRPITITGLSSRFGRSSRRLVEITATCPSEVPATPKAENHLVSRDSGREPGRRAEQPAISGGPRAPTCRRCPRPPGTTLSAGPDSDPGKSPILCDNCVNCARLM